jgi:hypothetical protein
MALGSLFCFANRTVLSAVVNSSSNCSAQAHQPPHRADLLRRPAEKLNNPLHKHSIFRWLDLLNKRITHCLNKRIYSHEASEADSIVCTIAAGIVRTKIQTIHRINCLNNRRILCLDKRIRFQTSSIVATIAVRLIATKKSSLSCFMTASLYIQRQPHTITGQTVMPTLKIKGVTLES